MNLENLEILIRKKYKRISRFSNAIGVANSTVSGLLNGEKNTGYRVYNKILGGLDIDVDAIIDSELLSEAPRSKTSENLLYLVESMDIVARKMFIRTLEKELSLEFANQEVDDIRIKLEQVKNYFYLTGSN